MNVRFGNLKIFLTVVIAAGLAYQQLGADQKRVFSPWVEPVVAISIAAAYALEKYLQRSVGTDQEQAAGSSEKS